MGLQEIGLVFVSFGVYWGNWEKRASDWNVLIVFSFGLHSDLFLEYLGILMIELLKDKQHLEY
jgi:hypothetical protein